MTATLRDAILAGGYWIHPPAPGAELAIVYTGAVAPEAEAAFAAIRDEVPGAGLLAVTSADRLNAGWHAAQKAQRMLHPYEPCLADRLLAPLSPDAALVTVLDGHPATLSWLGAVRGHRVRPLGVEHFGQSGTIGQLYAKYGIDTDTIVDACAAALVDRARGRP
jgi:pyruvate dehydrogenase E1 component